jgi:ribosomal protein S18 acetylase RimI-like enzyme
VRSALRPPATEDRTLVLRGDGMVARVRPAPAEPATGLLAVVDRSSPLEPDVLASWIERIGEAGFERVRTSAIGPTSVPVFLEAGFTVGQELVLLQHTLAGRADRGRPPRRRVRLRAPRRDDLVWLALVDRLAFGARWALDSAGIVDACEATPSHRVRVVRDRTGGPTAYAVSGRAGRAAYLQRLAVRPLDQNRGIGRVLVADSLQWAGRHHCTTMLVNTHVDNDVALHLYRSCGFVELDYRLAVLERALS